MNVEVLGGAVLGSFWWSTAAVEWARPAGLGWRDREIPGAGAKVIFEFGRR